MSIDVAISTPLQHAGASKPRDGGVVAHVVFVGWAGGVVLLAVRRSVYPRRAR
jgi:hypothetical protein